MADQPVIDRTAAQMRKRLQRAERRYAELQESLKARELTAVEDDLASIISEVKNISYDFCRCCEEHGLKKEGYPRINRWRDARLDASAAKAWKDAGDLRDCDVHESPVQPVIIGAGFLVLQTEKGILPLQIHGKVKVQSDRTGEFDLEPFCRMLMESTRTFVAEFHTLL